MYTLSGGICACASGYYKVTTATPNTCVKCPGGADATLSKCATCSAATTCLTCLSGYYGTATCTICTAGMDAQFS